ncbi:hypothetical protein ACFQZZ_15390 [Nocardia sp. GCM10030253]|uniref:hypothetical protein n=1 Tax=Nocardia sp. GCM10030253 TaxID=3273404 RepID=UPI00363A346E
MVIAYRRQRDLQQSRFVERVIEGMALRHPRPSLATITRRATRRAYRRRVRDQINERITVVTDYLPAPERVPAPPKPAKSPPAPPLRAYLED